MATLRDLNEEDGDGRILDSNFAPNVFTPVGGAVAVVVGRAAWLYTPPGTELNTFYPQGMSSAVSVGSASWAYTPQERPPVLSRGAYVRLLMRAARPS